MASLSAACRLSARLAARKLPHEGAVRGFRASAAALAAQNFTMPALSPTMTEGNIANWRVKEGDKFSAGDVLLEIETDKATMDVEAQEDGKVFKIMQGNGSKAVQVGTRIAVLAEESDDLSALEIPPDEGPKQAASAPEAAKQESAPAPEAKSESTSSQSQQRPAKTGGKAPKQKYPLLPSVQHLLRENGLDDSVISEITPTGPNGRLLKGDVLAYMGKIDAQTPAKLSERFEKDSHLDLSNIKVAKAPEPKKAEKAAAAVPEVAEEDLVVSKPVSLAAVIEVQRKIQDTLGTFIPLSTFIARAADVANDELPLSADAKPTADALFNQVLGLDKVGIHGSRGFYLPQITALSPTSIAGFAPPLRAAAKEDIIDVLAKPSRASSAKPKVTSVGLSTGLNVFSLEVPKAEQRRAQTFLNRVKAVLENEPGRLIL